ncbi:mycothiol synthase [Mycolicibacterium sp.]|uniref:mycothiol synthase n=1 Tax=Mycolicibacterium sp. TaxID=2320850 RepID=UPI001A2A0A43|nr:mycothiol synthase [Mycolicibacterium sp.]MBJ7339932.1 mycothiol synthase [Mycolicibacterium sp.]
MTEIDWWTALSGADQRQIADLLAAATAADGTAPVGDQVLRELPHDRTGHLVANVDDVVVGYLNLVPAGDDAPAMAEVVVHPDARRKGIGSALIRTGLAKGGHGSRVWAHGNLEPAKATAAALDLVSARELLQMRRSLRDLPAVTVSDGIRLRTYAGPSDDAELLRVNNAAFSWHPEQGGWTDADVAERRAESWFDPEGLFLAFDADTGALLGFHWTKVHGPALGEVYVVGVDPGAQGRGLGATLTLMGLHHLADRLGASADVTLYVEANNSAAVKTYERLDFGVFSADVAYTRR